MGNIKYSFFISVSISSGSFQRPHDEIVYFWGTKQKGNWPAKTFLHLIKCSLFSPPNPGVVYLQDQDYLRQKYQ